MNILIPGRHQILTDFQFKYFYALGAAGLEYALDRHGIALGIKEPVSRFLWAVTSANHQGTRRNPLCFAHRALMIGEMARDLEVPSLIFGIEDLGQRDDFAQYCLKKIHHESDNEFSLSPDNTIVAVSTPVADLYEALGFKILPIEARPDGSGEFLTPTAWEMVERIAKSQSPWDKDPEILRLLHPAAHRIWKNYRLGERARVLFSDKMIGSDGDLTETRDYGAYVAQMDNMTGVKVQETAPFVLPGRIGDIGCAVGSWIKALSEDPRFQESDFFGIEIARQLYEICNQRVSNREFKNPFVFFSQKNAVSGLVFEKESMDTIHTSSLTHEIESYGGRKDLLAFISLRHQELKPGGRWINRDVVGPENPGKSILLWAENTSGSCKNWDKNCTDQESLREHLEGLSTLGRFYRFAKDFRSAEGYQLKYTEERRDGGHFLRMKFSDACEFASRKDYIDNWQSEMHEIFTFWSWTDWCLALGAAGFRILPGSRAFNNPWITENRWQGKIQFYEDSPGALKPIDWPVTTMVLAAEKVLI